MATVSIEIQTVGRRHYLMGNTYAAREVIKGAGGHWDSDRRAWWIGKREQAEAILAAIGSESPAPATSESQVVAGKANYKGKTFHLAGRIIRGDTHWDDCVQSIESRNGDRLMLVRGDGKTFWADRAAVEITKTYQKPQSLEGLRRFAEGMRNGTVPVCHYCGSPSCDGARGGHCQED